MPLREPTPLDDALKRLSALLIALYVLGFTFLFFYPFTFSHLVVRAIFGRDARPSDLHWLFPSLFGIALVFLALHVFRNFRRGSIFPTKPPESVRFEEKGASGRSFRTFWYRFGGANNCLTVTVTGDELWTRLGAPFSFLSTGREWGLENRIPLDRILRTEERGWFAKAVRIYYRDENGQEQQLELGLRKREEFLRALYAGAGVPVLKG